MVATAENPSETDEDSEGTGNEQAEIDSSTDTTQESSDEAEPSSDETSPEEDSDSKKIDTTGEEDAMIEGEPKSDA